MAADGPPGVGEGNGRGSVALSIGGAKFLLASSRPTGTGDF